MPRTNENVLTLDAVAPVTTRLLLIDADPDKGRFVHDIVFSGLSFQDADWDVGPDGYADVQAAVEIGAAIKLTGAVDCAIEHCAIARVGGYAMDLGRGCKRNRITGNEIVGTGAGGIKLGWGREGLQPPHNGEGYMRYTSAADLNADNLITDTRVMCFQVRSVFGRDRPFIQTLLIIISTIRHTPEYQLAGIGDTVLSNAAITMSNITTCTISDKVS